VPCSGTRRCVNGLAYTALASHLFAAKGDDLLALVQAVRMISGWWRDAEPLETVLKRCPPQVARQVELLLRDRRATRPQSVDIWPGTYCSIDCLMLVGMVALGLTEEEAAAWLRGEETVTGSPHTCRALQRPPARK
jgi:hypothetical protein